MRLDTETGGFTVCGRFVQFSLFPILQKEFGLKFGEDASISPSYNITPTQTVPVVVNEGGNRLISCRWGLILPWAKDMAIGSRMINARAETLAEKPSFKGLFRKHRCLVVADGFYEWKKTETGKVPVYIHMKGGSPMGFAGLYSDLTSPDGELIRTCTIVTTGPNTLLAPIHDRMPAIIEPGKRKTWLDPDQHDPDALAPLLGPYPASEMEAWEVSRAVNSPANDEPDNIRPLG
ncbi:MAG: SOS response-associated peptidase [bacterium]|nr:SOS response-associated peptidase [bacterium]